MADSYTALVADSLAMIGREAPTPGERLRQLLLGTSLQITIDRETFGVFADPSLRVAAPMPFPSVTLAAVGVTVAAVIGGRTTLEQVVLHDRLRVTGALESVARVHEALLQFAHAGVRSPSFPLLVERFRALSGAQP